MQSISKLIIVINFQLNREYIAKNLCIQKEIEDNCCKGSCHLKKQLDEEDNKEKLPALPFLKDKTEIELFCQTLVKLNLNVFGVQISSEHIHNSQIPSSPSFSIFHPPKC